MKTFFIVLGIIGLVDVIVLCSIILYGHFWAKQFKGSF